MGFELPSCYPTRYAVIVVWLFWGIDITVALSWHIRQYDVAMVTIHC